MTEKNGVITEFYANIADRKLTIYAVLKFREGTFTIKVPSETKKFVEEIVQKYDIAIPNKDLCLTICDKDNLIVYKFDIFSTLLDDCSIEDTLGHYAKYDELRDLVSLKPNVDIINIGFTFQEKTTNGVRIIGNVPIELLDTFCCFSLSSENIQEKQKENGISIVNGMVLEIIEDYSNEDWNGPQYHGSYCIHSNKECEAKGEYELSIRDFDKYENQKLIYTSNTIIRFYGSENDHLEAHFQLKNRELVRGISTLCSGIASEMETILQIQIYE